MLLTESEKKVFAAIGDPLSPNNDETARSGKKPKLMNPNGQTFGVRDWPAAFIGDGLGDYWRPARTPFRQSKRILRIKKGSRGNHGTEKPAAVDRK